MEPRAVSCQTMPLEVTCSKAPHRHGDGAVPGMMARLYPLAVSHTFHRRSSHHITATVRSQTASRGFDLWLLVAHGRSVGGDPTVGAHLAALRVRHWHREVAVYVVHVVKAPDQAPVRRSAFRRVLWEHSPCRAQRQDCQDQIVTFHSENLGRIP